MSKSKEAAENATNGTTTNANANAAPPAKVKGYRIVFEVPGEDLGEALEALASNSKRPKYMRDVAPCEVKAPKMPRAKAAPVAVDADAE